MKRKSLTLLVCAVILVALIIAVLAFLPSLKKQLYPREYSDFVTKYASEYSVPEALVYAIIQNESNFNPNAESHAGAKGLMQLMPDTFSWISKKLCFEDEPTGEITDPETNIKYGVAYLKYLYDRFGNWETVLAAYNAGPNKVSSWLKDTRYSEDGKTLSYIPYSETDNYVNRVISARDEYAKIYYNGEC